MTAPASAPKETVTARPCDELTTGGVLLTLAATTLGLALQYSSGTLSDVGIAGLTLAFAEAWAAQGQWRSRTTINAASIAGLCIGAEVAMLLTDNVARIGGRGGHVFVALVVVLGTIAGLCFIVPRTQHARGLACAALVSCFLGWWVLRSAPVPGIDVLIFQRDAAAALLRGVSPYSIEFRDPYPPEASALYYGAGVSVNGVLKFGYPYMPLTLLLTLPGYLLGDVRYASLFAIVASACLIGFARPSWSSTLAALLLLLSPAVPTMILNGWNDSFLVLFVALAWFCQCRKPAAVPFVIGLLFATKQYLIVAVPLVLLLIEKPWTAPKLWSFCWKAASAGSLVTLPFVMWDAHGFLASVVSLQGRQPFRHDALSYVALLNPANPGGWLALPFALAFGTSVLFAFSIKLRRASFAVALALTMLPFFAFNKQAFLNYYFLVLGCLCCAISSEPAWRKEPEQRTFAPGTRGDPGLRLL